MKDFTDKQQVSIYVETLFQLSRDAWRKGRMDAFDFISSHLVGLVPASALDGFMAELDPDHGTNVRARLDTSKPTGNGNGGTLIPVPKPPPPLPPANFQVRESEVLKW